MFQDEVEKVELPAIAQLQQLGWRYVPGARLSKSAEYSIQATALGGDE